MDNLNKREAMKAWLEENKGKTERDWLLEVRCPDERTRTAAAHLLDTLEKGNVNYGICVELKNHIAQYMQAPMSDVESIVFDLMIAPGDVARCSYIFEMDMPDAILGQLTENKRGDAIPEEAYKWLLRQWLPDFDLTSLDEKQYRNLMWDGLGAYLGKYQGNRGFPNWKKKSFAEELLERIKWRRERKAIP